MGASLLYLVLRRLLTLVAPNHRSDQAAQIEILVLRHQLRFLRRQVKRPVYRNGDRALLAAASRILPREHWGAFLVRPETLQRWHRSLVAQKWTRPHRRPGRPAIDPAVCKLNRAGFRVPPCGGNSSESLHAGHVSDHAGRVPVAVIAAEAARGRLNPVSLWIDVWRRVGSPVCRGKTSRPDQIPPAPDSCVDSAR
jgi:hypothetical protein